MGGTADYPIEFKTSLLWFKVDSGVAQLGAIGAGVLLRTLALNLRWQLPHLYIDGMSKRRN